MRQAGLVSATDVTAARLQRLRRELRDEQVRVPIDDGLGDLVVAELDYARHPHAHEGIAPRYGALLTTGVLRRDAAGPFSVVHVGDVSLDVVRRLADGRSSFVARTVGGSDRLVCFDRTREYESSAVHLALASGAIVIQRLGRGWVRLTTPDGVATWDGIGWATKPLSMHTAALVAPMLPEANAMVLGNLLEFCVHWLGAGRIGAAIVWLLEGDATELVHLGFGTSVEIPPLDVTNRSHFAALLNALSQYDRAALVDARGSVRTVGVHLRASEDARRDIAPFRGTRHTSALRFSADAPNAAVFVVSSNGTLSVLRNGRRLDTA